MKAVLFCGGLGMRLRDYSQTIPKPMVKIGYQPILWYLMKHYAHFGVKDFILCLGYRGDVVKDYFLNYSETISNDFVLSNGGTEIELYNRDIQDWKITFADTGLHANIGQRLAAVQHYLEGEDLFLANYSDGVSDFPLDKYLEFVRANDRIGNFMSVRPTQSFHVVQSDDNHRVTDICPIGDSVRINAGYFAFKREIFDYIKEGEELVMEPFQRLVKEGQLMAYPYEGFWKCMDTFKDKQEFDDMYAKGDTPWILWR